VAGTGAPFPEEALATRHSGDLAGAEADPGAALAAVTPADWLVLTAILLVSAATYALTLDDWFWGDDLWFLRSSATHSFWDYALKSLDFRETGSLPEFDRYRPLYPIVWRGQYALFDLNAAGYHATILLLHLANTVLVWLIVFKITRLTWTALLAAAIFTLHPGYTDAVAWLSGANRAFVALPYLVSFLAFILSWESQRRLRWAWLTLSVAGFVAAILMHSAAITLALVIPAYAFLLGKGVGDVRSPTNWLPFLPFAAITIALLGIQLWVRDHLGVAEQFEFGWHQYAVYGNYFGRALFPVFPLETTLINDRARAVLEAGEGLASVALLLLCVALVVQRWRRELGIFAVLWFILALFPDSTLRFLTSGRVLYLAGSAFALLISVTAMWVESMLPSRVRPAAARAALAVALLIVVAAIPLTIHHSNEQANAGEANQRFVQQLRSTIDEVPPGGTLYVLGAPANIIVFDDTRLDALVELYFGPTDVRSVSPAELDAVRETLGRDDRIFEFRRP
jgi:hypothetical protein